MSASVKTYDFTMDAGASAQVFAVGTYFRIQTCTGALSVVGEFGEVSPILAGQGLKNSPFTRLQLKNLTAFPNSGSIIVASDEFVDQQMVLSGVVSTNQNNFSNVSQNDVTVTTSSNQVLAARAARRYLLIQNKNASGNVSLSLSGSAVLGGGISLPPGGMYEPLVCGNGAINAIGDLASNPNLLVLEGY